jgi:serine protease inhibitor
VSHTKSQPFYDEDGNVSGNVLMMTQKGPFPYTAIADLESHVLQLPYGSQDRLSMVFLMPRKGTKLMTVMEKLEDVRFERIFQELDKAAKEYEDDEVEVHIPKFTVTADFTLNAILMDVG